jgi:hypothetical protein
VHITMMQSSVAHCNNMTAGGRPNEPKSIPEPRVYLVGGPVPRGALVPQAVMASDSLRLSGTFPWTIGQTASEDYTFETLGSQ